MSRFKRYAHSLLSGYVLLGANMLYTLASIPLALHYLGKAQFGLWALVTQVAGYVALVDFGLSATASRMLIDYKDRRASGDYGSMVQTGALVGLTQGSLVMIVGIVLAFVIGPILKVEAELQHEFTLLMIGQCVLVGLGFYTRILTHMLTAHQRYDIANYTQSILFATSFIVMWFCFERGMGVYSVLWANASGTLVVVVVNYLSCARLKFLPARGEWGRPNRKAFGELFAFGRDFFLFALGAQLINASQTILLTRLVGLEAAAVWSVCTRTFLVLSQVVYRIFDYSSAALAEMMVRGERLLLQKRFREIVTFSASLGVAGATMLALCNSSFISVWTSGRINSLQVFPADIKRPELLVARMQNQNDAAAQWLLPKLSPELQAAVKVHVTGIKAEDKLKTQLAVELNGLLQGPTLYDPQKLAGVTLSEKTQVLAGAATNSDNIFRFNRYLVEDVFPVEFANSRKAHWSPWNDFLLGIWLIVCVVINAHIGLVGQTKMFGFLRFLAFIESAVFICLTLLFYRFGGMTMMLALSILCSLVFRLPYGLSRTRRYFNISPTELGEWHRTIPRLIFWLLPVGVASWWFTRWASDMAKLVLLGIGMGGWTVFVLLRFGLPDALRQEIFRRSPDWAKPGLRRCGLKAH